MKSVLVFALIASVVVAPSVGAAQENPRTWRGIRKLQPGADVAVWTSRSDLHYRYFASADDGGVTVLDLHATGLPSNVAKVLQRALAEHPKYFVLPDGKKIMLDDGVTIDASGVFADSRKLQQPRRFGFTQNGLPAIPPVESQDGSLHARLRGSPRS